MNAEQHKALQDALDKQEQADEEKAANKALSKLAGNKATVAVASWDSQTIPPSLLNGDELPEKMTDPAEKVLAVLGRDVNRGKVLKQLQISQQLLNPMRTPVGEHSIRKALEILRKNGFSEHKDGTQGDTITPAGIAYSKSRLAAP